MTRYSFRVTLAVIGSAASLIVGACQNALNVNTGSYSSVSHVDATSENTLRIVSSLPMTGASLAQAQTIVNGINQALAETNSTVCNGKTKIDYQAWDDATAAAGKWDAAQETANANKAVDDKDIVAYIGPASSGAAKLSIPILNQANIVMVSPAATYPGLTKPEKGEGKEPNIYYPNGKRNFARVVPTDDLQGKAAAKWARAMGVKKVYILDDQELYGKGIADVFEVLAKQSGLQVLGHEGIEPKATDYKALMTKIKALNPDLIYYGGITNNNAGQLVKDMRNVGMVADKVRFMGPDGIFDKSFIDAAGRDSEGIYATFGGVPPKELTGLGRSWYKNYKNRYNAEPEAEASYGYEAAKVVIKGINRVCKNDRTTIREAVMHTKHFKGLLGTWSFDRNGDMTLTTMSGSQVRNGKWVFVTLLKA